MSRWIDADGLIADMQERYCKPCKDKGEDYHEVRCRACWVDDAIGEIDGFADNSIDLVRCKECKYCDDAGSQRALLCNSPFIDMDIHPDDFCSYGERKESE